MAYQKEDFMSYLYKKKYANPGGYCNALDNIEKHFHVNIDLEFEQDQCKSLHDRIQQMRKTPEQIGKNEHDVRTYASRLNKYIEFRLDYEEDNPISIAGSTSRFDSLESALDSYLKGFSERKQKIIFVLNAVKTFQENWDIDSDNFVEMFNKATKTSSFVSISRGISKRTIVYFAEKSLQQTKALFSNLYDESQPLEVRSDNFYLSLEKLSKDFNLPVHDRTAFVYLFLRYPEKYYVFKTGDLLILKKLITGNDSIKQSGSHTQKMLEAYNIFDTIKAKILKNYDFCQEYTDFVLQNGYEEPGMGILVSDFCKYVAVHHGHSTDYPTAENELVEDGSPIEETSIYPTNEVGETVYSNSYTKQHFLNEVYISEKLYDSCVSRLKHKKNLIIQGAPGVGKTFAARRLAWSIMGVKDNNRVEFVQFHQNYSYEDFIMGYKPANNGFSLEKGVFYKFCVKAKEDPHNDYFFIIDEINRGNMSKIFGELLMLIENDYRGMDITLAYNKELFSVPENLYIIGMMNTADRSLAMIDYALRRRFSFVEVTPGFDSAGFLRYQNTVENQIFANLISKIKALNADIENDASLGKGFCIGHSYFCNLSSPCPNETLREIVECDIIPTLEEYWFDDEAKAKSWSNDLRGVFND